MELYPAIDLFEKQAVRLFKGDYAQMTVYSHDPVAVAMDFRAAGAKNIHLVDLEGAKSGQTPNFETICAIKRESGLFCEVGGGIRSMETVHRYLEAGLDRVILGTAAVTDPKFLDRAVAQYGEKIAVGIDVKDGKVAIRGWTEESPYSAPDFCRKMEKAGVRVIVCTDISKDGAMQGASHDLYRELMARFELRFIASGGVSSLEDIRRLKEAGLYGAILGKAYYSGAVNLQEALEVSK